MITKTQNVDVLGMELRMQVQYVSCNELINTRIKKFRYTFIKHQSTYRIVLKISLYISINIQLKKI